MKDTLVVSSCLCPSNDS